MHEEIKETEHVECLLNFGQEYFVFHFAIKNLKTLNTYTVLWF